MYRLSIVATIVLTTLLIFAGCAKKPISADTTVAAILPAAETLASANVAEQQVTDTTSAATITTFNGMKLNAIYFEYDSTTLSAEARQALVQNADWLKTNPDVNVTIEGHCDERGSDEYNFALGENRAVAVKKYLSELGVAVARLATISYGEERPATDGHDEMAWAKNRRSEFN
jgi:peptidoglycan-associated lipoprotein